MRRLLVVLAALLVVVVLADRGAALAADRVIAGRLESQLGTRPSVDVRGVPFLTQAAQGRYDEVRLSAPSVQRGAVRLEQVQATLNGVRVPLTSVVEGALQTVPVDRLTLGAVVPWSDLSALVTGRDVQIAPGVTPGEVQVLAAVDVLGKRVTVGAVSSVQLDGRTLVLTARDLKVGPASAPPAVVRALGGDLDLRLPLPPLPYGVQLTAARSTAAGLALAGTAQQVVLRP